MKYTEGKMGRVFVLRLEDDDKIPDCIESFARSKKIATGQVMLIGGVGKGDVVVGPRNSQDMPPQKMVLPIDGAHEVLALGVLAPDEQNRPVLHIHGSLGRSGRAVTGCLREGVHTWLVCEAVIMEITDLQAGRRVDDTSGFVLLDI